MLTRHADAKRSQPSQSHPDKVICEHTESFGSPKTLRSILKKHLIRVNNYLGGVWCQQLLAIVTDFVLKKFPHNFYHFEPLILHKM